MASGDVQSATPADAVLIKGRPGPGDNGL